MLDCSDHIDEGVRYKGLFAILKVAMIKVNLLLDICEGKRNFDLKFDEAEF